MRRAATAKYRLGLARRRRRGPHFTQRGVALIAVALAISVITVLTTEFSTNMTTGHVAAANHRDNMRADFLAQSAMEVAEVLLRAQAELGGAADAQGQEGMNPMSMLGAGDITEFSPMIATAIGGSREESAALASTVGLPVEPDDLRGIGLEAGRFSLDIQSDDGKINLNCANGSDQTRQNLFAQLQALFYFEAYDPVFRTRSADGWTRTREEQAAAMIDYVDTNQTRFGERGVPQQYGYEELGYEAKNHYVDTTRELRLVRGVDERFWTLFGDYFTIYGDCAINLREVSSPRVIAAIILLAADDDDHPALSDEQELWELAQTVLETQQLMGQVGFDSVDAFAALVEDPEGGLESVIAQQFGEELGAEGLGAPGAEGGPGSVQGVTLDREKLGEIVSAGERQTYRVTATAELGEDEAVRIERRVEGVWDTETRNQNMRDPAYRQGSWVFWREE